MYYLRIEFAENCSIMTSLPDVTLPNFGRILPIGQTLEAGMGKVKLKLEKIVRSRSKYIKLILIFLHWV